MNGQNDLTQLGSSMDKKELYSAHPPPSLDTHPVSRRTYAKPTFITEIFNLKMTKSCDRPHCAPALHRCL